MSDDGGQEPAVPGSDLVPAAAPGPQPPLDVEVLDVGLPAADLSPRPPRAAQPRPEIPPLDAPAMHAARALVNADPRLGRLGDVVAWIAGARGGPPRPFTAPVAFVVAGRHEAARFVGTADGAEVGRRLGALRSRWSPGVRLQVLDLGEASTGRIDRQDAVGEDEALRAFAFGREAVDQEVDGGADLLLVGDIDADDGPAVATLASLLTGREPVACLPRGGDPAGWARAVEVVRDARRRGRSRTGHPLRLLAAVGGTDLAALTGVLVQAAVRRTPVLLDGPAATVCGLVAEAYAEGCSIWWTAASRSGDPAHDLALRALQMEPLLELGLGYDGAAAAVLALPLLQAAAVWDGSD